MAEHFDYIIAGAGLSGLSLAWHLTKSPLGDKKILLVDEDLSPANEKIWSFWHKGVPPFRDCIHKSWRHISVIFDSQIIQNHLQNYTYHSIRSGTFTKYIYRELKPNASLTMHEAKIQSLAFGDQATLSTANQTFTADYIFQSCLSPPGLKKDQPHYPLIQHFTGWEITTGQPVFTPDTVTLMDFDTEFNGGIAFVYILPWTDRQAMIEYTIFSDTLRDKAFYKEKIELYLHNKFGLRRLDYKVERTETGRIPMQDRPYIPWYDEDILNMGTVGGLTKPSTGYTFSRIQRHARQIVTELKKGNPPALPPRSPRRYRAYDLWLLHIMQHHPRQAIDILRQLFSHNTVDEVFRFLSEENTLAQDLKTMSSVSYLPFLKAIWQSKGRLPALM